MTVISELSEFERKQILKALEHILCTDKFVAAPQMSAFLRYVVEQTLSGNKSRIKAYTVAVDALGKPDTFDPQNDPVVRVLAGRLRTSLEGYYTIHSQVTVVIQLKPGSYVPAFINQQNKAEHSRSTSHIGQTAIAPERKPTNEHVDNARNSNKTLLQTPAEDKHLEGKGGKHEQISLNQPNSGHADTSDNSSKDNQTPPGLLMSLLRRLHKLPIATIAASMLAFLLLASLLGRSVPVDEPQIIAANPVKSEPVDTSLNRARPDQISLFVSAVDEGDSLENQLNNIVSGVFAESEDVRIYRILGSGFNHRFWPEDYVLSLEVLPLSTETRIEIQLVAARTGRISHTDTLVLSTAATQKLTRMELEQITEFSRNLISRQGPLITDYQVTNDVVY